MNQTNVPSILEVALPISAPSKGQREYRTFLRLLPKLLTTHQGKYVAIHDDQVVDSDADDIALVQRVHARFGYVPIHVGLVIEPQPAVRVPHYREHRGPRSSP